MKEQLIKFNTAKLAKEKGFDVKCIHHHYSNAISKAQRLGFPFKEEDLLQIYGGFGRKNSELSKKRYAAPTQSLLQKWLREVHNIDVWAQPFVKNQSLPDESYSYFVYKDGVWQNDGVDMLDFEEALEKGLQEALKLI
jgi:hypothetical protein